MLNHNNFDHALVTLRFENGLIAHVEGSWSQPEGTPFSTSYEIAGTKGLYEYKKKIGVYRFRSGLDPTAMARGLSTKAPWPWSPMPPN